MATDLELKSRAAVDGLQAIKSFAGEVQVLGLDTGELGEYADQLGTKLDGLAWQNQVIQHLKVASEAAEAAGASSSVSCAANPTRRSGWQLRLRRAWSSAPVFHARAGMIW